MEISLFEVYYCRKVNRSDWLSQLPVAQDWDQTEEKYEWIVVPKPRDYTRRTKDYKRMQQLVTYASKKKNAKYRTTRKGLRNNPISL